MKVKSPKVKERMRSSGKVDGRTKTHKPKKGKGAFERAKKAPEEDNENFSENTDIVNFIDCILKKNYASANKYIKQAVESKLQNKIEQELETPLFQ